MVILESERGCAPAHKGKDCTMSQTHKLARMSKAASLAALIVMTVPALADDIVASHEVHFEQLSFVCGEKNASGKVVRFMHSTPALKVLPENELPPGDPLAKSWDIAYRIFCEGDHQQTETFAKDHQRSLR